MEETGKERLSAEVRALLGEIDVMLERVNAAGPAGGGTFEQMREAALAATEEIYAAAGGSAELRTTVAEHSIAVDGGEIAARVYTPAGDGPFPAVLQIHGGAWVMGSIEWPTFRAFADELAARIPAVVVAVDYRLAPEFQFPVGLEDCFTALLWLVDRVAALDVDAERIAIAGDSAGANLAAAVCLLARDRGGPPIVAQLLEIPAPDHANVEEYNSAREFATGWGLETESLVLGRQLYFADPEDAQGPLASPLLAEDLSGLPPTHVMTAEFDVLRDSGEAFARRLEEAGVATTLSRKQGHIHGSGLLLHPRWEGAREWRDEVIEVLRAATAEPSSQPGAPV